jgi:hypothetical protein
MARAAIYRLQGPNESPTTKPFAALGPDAGAFGGRTARPRNSVAQPANPEPDGATQGSGARRGG